MGRTLLFQWSALGAALTPVTADAARTATWVEAANSAAVALRKIGSREREAGSTVLSPARWSCVPPSSLSLFAAMRYMHQQGHAAVGHANGTTRGVLERRDRMNMSNNEQGEQEDPTFRGLPADLPPFASRVLQAAEDTSVARGKEFWTSQREEASHCIEQRQLPPYVVAMLMAAFARAGELTEPLATMVAHRFIAALKEARRRTAGPLFLQERGPHDKEALAVAQEMTTSVDFSAVATLLVAMRDSGLLGEASARIAARALQDELLLYLQCQGDSLTFGQLRRVLLLLGATAELLGLQMATVRELFRATKKLLRKMQKKGHLVEGGDARDSIALLWPLANISMAMGLPLPQNRSNSRGSSSKESCAEASCSSREEFDALQLDRDILLHLLKSDVSTALSSRLPCSPFDLALGFIGLERLGQRYAADYVLAAFSAAAGAASGDEIRRLGREILLTGAVQKALWDAFADVAATALHQERQDLIAQHESHTQRITAELAQWLRFCGRLP